MIRDAVLERLDRKTCEALLADECVGRVAIVLDGWPHVVPVNYAADGPTIVFQTATGSSLTDASMARVVFEVDGVHSRKRAGWSVCVRGHALDITDSVAPEARRLRDLCIDCWAPEGRDRYFMIIPTSVTGRRVGPVPEKWNS
jgi:nitroimidazol reductase NimA-like FMN-containing flavoprotein (pyridoxamine 5'-phosphate oxidase superfamily)